MHMCICMCIYVYIYIYTYIYTHTGIMPIVRMMPPRAEKISWHQDFGNIHCYLCY